MFIELIDQFRCPAPHEETWLVAAVDRLAGRHIAEGTLGCPVCRMTYPIAHGALALSPAPSEPRVARAAAPVDPAEVLRARALLDLAEPGGVVLLSGPAAELQDALQQECDAEYLLLNPVGIVPEPGRSVVWAEPRLPLANGALRAAYVCGEGITTVMLESIVAGLRVGGRVVVPAGVGVPAGVTLLARDDREWVGVRDAGVSSRPVSLSRREGPR